MARQRHLVLTREQESNLVSYLEKRILDLKRDNRERIDADKQSDTDYQNSKEYRAKSGTIFEQSNVSLPLTSWVVDHFASRTEDELFSRKPMAKFSPEGPPDLDLSRGVDRWANFKLFKLGKIDSSLIDAQQSIWTHRAMILKAIYFEDADTWAESGHVVLHDRQAGDTPVEILDHGFIIQGRDVFIDVVDPVTGQPAKVLEPDPTFMLDPTRHYWAPAKEAIRFRDVRYSGPKSLEVDSDCFLAPMSARTLQEADCVVEFYDKPIHWLRERFVDREGMTFEQFKARLGQQTAKPKTESRRNDQSKENLGYDLESSLYPIVEVWLERDVLGWGAPQRIVVWMEKKTKTLIDFEFQKMVTPHGRHPYTAIAAWKPHGGKYWWGKSIVEMVRVFQDYIDLQWNRHSYRNAVNANPIVMQNPDAIQEKKTFHEIKPFDTVTAESGTTRIEDWLQVFTFPKLDLDTQELIEKVIYWCNFWLGISNIAQGDYSDVPQNTTLGGQETTLREASKLSRRWTRRIKEGFEDHLGICLQIAVATMDPQEAFTYLDGENEQLGFISADAVRDLKFNVSLAIGRDNTAQDIQRHQLTMQIVERYFQYPPEMQLALRPVIKMQLFLLGHDNVDALIPLPMLPAIDPVTGQPVAQPAGAAQDPNAAGGSVVPFEPGAEEGEPAPPASAAP